MNIKKDRKGKKASIRKLFASSMILKGLGRVSSAIYRSLSSGLFARLFTCFEKEHEIASESLISRGAKRLDLGRRVAFPVKHKIAYWSENSVLIGLIKRLFEALLAYPMKAYGIFLFSFSFYSAIVYILKLLYFNDEAIKPDIGYIASIGGMIVASVLMISSRHCLGSALRTSPMARFLLFKVVGLRENCLDHVAMGANRLHIALFFGLLFGFSSIVVHPIIAVAIIPALAFACLIFIKPEFGVLVIITMLPFLPTMVLVAAVLFVAGCYFLKVIIGKRSLKFDLLDTSVLAFMLLMIGGGIVSMSSASMKPMLVYVAFMFGYFLVVNLIRSAEWINKCIIGSVASCALVSLYGLYQNFFGTVATTWLDTKMFSNIQGRVVSTFENPNVLAEYLIMLLPLMVGMVFLAKTPRSKFAMFLSAALTAACLIYTWSRGAWLGILLGMMIFFLMYSKNTLTVMMLGLFAVPFLPFVLPDSVVHRFTSIGNMGDSSTSYRVNIWRGVVDMVGYYWHGGIGIGYEPFRAVYPQYSLEAIEAAPHSHNLYLQILVELGAVGLIVFAIVLILLAQSHFSIFAKNIKKEKLIPIALFCGTVAVLAQGMTDYIWYNYRVYLMFWLLVGLGVAARKVLAVSADDGKYT